MTWKLGYLGVYRDEGFPTLRIPSGDPYNKDYSTVESILGPVFLETPYSR